MTNTNTLIRTVIQAATVAAPSVLDRIFAVTGPEVVNAPPQLGTTNEQAPAKPPMYAVILHNDHSTMPNFVVQVLREAFSVEGQKAHQVMMAAHTGDKAVVKVTTQELAETQLARAEGMIRTAEPGRDFGRHVAACELRFTVELETQGE